MREGANGFTSRMLASPGEAPGVRFEDRSITGPDGDALPLPPDRPKRRVRYITKIDAIPNIPDAEKLKLKKVAEKYVFRSNDYYLDLIDWSDPNDPIRSAILMPIAVGECHVEGVNTAYVANAVSGMVTVVDVVGRWV